MKIHLELKKMLSLTVLEAFVKLASSYTSHYQVIQDGEQYCIFCGFMK